MTTKTSAREIHKFRVPCPTTPSFGLDLPAGAEILDVQMQHGHTQLWALVDPQAPTQRRDFQIVGTGRPVAADLQYVGTWQDHDGVFVWHLFVRAL